MRILLICNKAPLSPNYGGGTGTSNFERLCSLHELGCELHLWHIAFRGERKRFEKFVAADGKVWADVQKRCASVTLTTLRNRSRRAKRWQQWVNPAAILDGARDLLKRHDETVRPDAIWANNISAGHLATRRPRRPIIYSHHDWFFRTRALKEGRPENRRHRWQEEQVARRADVVTSGSVVEVQQLRQLECRQVYYLPSGRRPVASPPAEQPLPHPRIVHLGGMNSAASRGGLVRFFEAVWPRLRGPAFRYRIIGDMRKAPASLLPFLETAETTGYVSDLEPVLQPYDIHLIPYEFATGSRTCVPVALNHRQVIVATRAAVACMPELVDGVNCRKVEQLEHMADIIRELIADPAQRKRLADSGRATFEQQFTRKALLPVYQEILAAVAHVGLQPKRNNFVHAGSR